MSYPSRILAGVISLTLGCCLLPACGGAFEGGDDDGGPSASGGQSGGTGKGGSGAVGGSTGGRGGSAGSSGGSCEYGGQIYEDGESFPAGDGCNNCFCDNGSAACTTIDCPEAGCLVGDTFHPVGAEWMDGCNTCSCDAPDSWACDLAECPECTDLSATYAAAMDEAKTCDPQLTGQCSQVVFHGLQCGCDSFVNPENADAIALAEATRLDYNASSCGGDVLCGPCLPPVSSYCSSEGRCVDVYEYEAVGASCKVNGVVYASGETNVPAPFSSCNTCSCLDGQLSACTQNDCPDLACPPDSVPSSQCAQCGAANGCEVVEHACLPVCDTECAEGVCVQGVCKALCG